jgi:peptidoglycan/LPS O-acetylase OafA/YrhL
MKRIAELDALRGIAAIGIVAFHYASGTALGRVTYVGVLALELFFVLSGFLISSIIRSHEGNRGFLRTFYLRRGLRIWPAYYLFMLAIAAIVLVRPGFGNLRALPSYLTFT